MSIPKRTMWAGAAIAAVGMASVGGVGVASAATISSNDSSSQSSLVDKIATKFNLNKSDVQAVFDQDKTDHQAEMQQKVAERLAQAVKDGKITQEQSDYITNALKDIQTLMATTSPDQQTDATRQQIKDKMDALRSWAKDNNIDANYIGGGMMHGGPGGRGQFGDKGTSGTPDSESAN
jgi:uncharacterized membrane protein YhiD involved in acid resistance